MTDMSNSLKNREVCELQQRQKRDIDLKTDERRPSICSISLVVMF